VQTGFEHDVNERRQRHGGGDGQRDGAARFGDGDEQQAERDHRHGAAQVGDAAGLFSAFRVLFLSACFSMTACVDDCDIP
jgi:hypothetical protein